MSTKDAFGGFTSDDPDLSALKKEVLARLEALEGHEGEDTYEARKAALDASMDALLAAEMARKLAFRHTFAV